MIIQFDVSAFSPSPNDIVSFQLSVNSVAQPGGNTGFTSANTTNRVDSAALTYEYVVTTAGTQTVTISWKDVGPLSTTINPSSDALPEHGSLLVEDVG